MQRYDLFGDRGDLLAHGFEAGRLLLGVTGSDAVVGDLDRLVLCAGVGSHLEDLALIHVEMEGGVAGIVDVSKLSSSRSGRYEFICEKSQLHGDQIHGYVNCISENVEKRIGDFEPLPTIKPLLLDQTFLAGLGNIYVDEALWKAKIHPRRSSSSLTKNETAALHQAIPQVLNKGLKNMGTSLGTGKGNFYSVANRRGRNEDLLNVFRRTDLPCPRCKSPIERIVVGQRSTHICPRCQKV